MWWDSEDGNLYTWFNDGNSSQWVSVSQGPMGHQGVAGSSGGSGSQGHQGVQGAQGHQGVQGAVGAQGHQGRQGAQGVQGATGAQGHQGYQGRQGATGPQGHQGVQGATGSTGGGGSTGAQGHQGVQGAQGRQGAGGGTGGVGAQGATGAQGHQGVQGATGGGGGTGAQGHQGRQGAPGSANPNATEIYQTAASSNNNFACLFSDETVSSTSGTKAVQHDVTTFWFNPSQNKLTVQEALIPTLSVTNLSILPSGTRMIFQQSSAPTGWTKDTTDVHQRAMRVTSGNVSSGGNSDFTDVFRNWTTNSHTLTTSQIPSHRHWVSRAAKDDNNFSQWNTNTQEFGLYSDAGSYSASDQNHSVGRNTAYTGGGSGHNHGTMNFAVRYLDVIICSKD
jgi:hypothetical protein